MKEYIKRQIEDQLSYLSGHFPVIMISGARQVGKTTLLKHAFRKNLPTYVTLDYPRIRELARTDPELFLQQYPAPVIIDEIQYAPELLPYIKIAVDNDRTPGQYFLTGSQMFRMMKDVSESLAGRVGILTMYGMSQSEISGCIYKEPFRPDRIQVGKSKETITTVFDKIIRGGMPQMIIDPDLDPETYFGSYMQTYIERDIRDLIAIQNESKFQKFISCVAVRTGQELNLSDIAKDVGIDSKTADSWLSLMITSGLVYLLQPYSGNVIKRIVKRPKLYFMDTGLACYLSLWNNPRTLEISAMSGAIFETYVVSEIIKEYAGCGIDTRSRLAYYRDNNGKEIDLIIIENGTAYPIEIKKSADPGKEAIKNFSVIDSFAEERGKGAVICLSSELYPIDADNMIIPVGII